METSFRRFMNISIEETHLSVSEETYITEDGVGPISAKFANLKLGEDGMEDPIWNYNDLTNNYIKLRLESKNTGKKLDFNLIFNYNQPKNNN